MSISLGYSAMTQQYNGNPVTYSFDHHEECALLTVLANDRILVDWWYSLAGMFSAMDQDSCCRHTQGIIPFLQCHQVFVDNPNEYETEILIGVFYRKNAPIWVLEILCDLLRTMEQLNNRPGKEVLSVLVDTKESFDVWLGEAPHITDFSNDVALLHVDKILEKKIQEFEHKTYGWKLMTLPAIPCKISNITREYVELCPVGSLIRIFQSTFRIAMEDFEQACLTHQVALFAFPK